MIYIIDTPVNVLGHFALFITTWSRAEGFAVKVKHMGL
jgi:hypothetical protein